jgi:protease IV
MQAEILVDRRRLKRRLALWRLLAVLAVLGVIAVLVSQNEEIAASAGFQPHIARISISGVITDDRKQRELLQRAAKSDQVKAIILSINSPGGTTTGGEALFQTIRETAQKKPVVAVFGTIATSAAYLVAVATDHIVARGNTVTGSVGVILQWAEVTELLDNIGVKMEAIKSGPLKAVPSPFEPLDENTRAVTKEMVEESERWFRGLVAERRKIDPETVPGLVAGRVYSGRQALEYKLIDQIGGEKAARDWLERTHDISNDLDIVDWKRGEQEGYGLLGSTARTLTRMIGIPDGIAGILLAPLDAARAVQLDGLVSLWHPSGD